MYFFYGFGKRSTTALSPFLEGEQEVLSRNFVKTGHKLGS